MCPVCGYRGPPVRTTAEISIDIDYAGVGRPDRASAPAKLRALNASATIRMPDNTA